MIKVVIYDYVLNADVQQLLFGKFLDSRTEILRGWKKQVNSTGLPFLAKDFRGILMANLVDMDKKSFELLENWYTDLGYSSLSSSDKIIFTLPPDVIATDTPLISYKDYIARLQRFLHGDVDDTVAEKQGIAEVTDDTDAEKEGITEVTDDTVAEKQGITEVTDAHEATEIATIEHEDDCNPQKEGITEPEATLEIFESEVGAVEDELNTLEVDESESNIGNGFPNVDIFEAEGIDEEPEQGIPSAEEGVKPFEDKAKILEDDVKPFEDKAKILEDKAKILEDKDKILEDKDKILEDKAKILEDKAKILEDDSKKMSITTKQGIHADDKKIALFGVFKITEKAWWNKRKVAMLIIVVLASGILLSGGILAFQYFLSGKLTDNLGNQIRDDVSASFASLAEDTGMRGFDSEPVSLELPSNVEFAEDKFKLLEVDFEELKSRYPDVVGWLYIPGVDIEYPVVQCADNEYYLTHTIDGTISRSGWVFADYRMSDVIPLRNYLIYGHNMADGTSFGKLKRVLDEEWYSNPDNQYIYYATEYYTAVFQIYTIFAVKSEDVFYYDRGLDNNTMVDFLTEMSGYNKLPEGALKYETPFKETDNVITLSTCNDAQGYEKFVVQGILTYYKQTKDNTGLVVDFGEQESVIDETE